MNILTVDKITKAYGERKIFDNASFFLEEGEKAGIIGINGTGKSTLLKIIAGIEGIDSGNVIKANNYTVKYLAQTPLFEADDTVLEAVVKPNKTKDNQWDIEYDAKSMMTKLGISNFEEKCGNLSGGQRKRLALVSVLLSKADILLLDEPTNHLDSAMSAWLEDELKNYKGSIIMVTHDRYFLDSVTDRIIEVDKGNIYSYKENYSGYLELKAMREDIADAMENKRKNILRNELKWVQRGARARSTKQKARLQRFEELSSVEDIKKDETVALDSVASRLGKTTIEINDISKAFDDKLLIKNFSYNFLKNDRVGFIGNNGCGKTTLLKMILGEENVTSGSINIGPTVKIGYFTQEVRLGVEMKPESRVIDYIREEAEFVNTNNGKISAARLLENFLFKGEDQYGLIGKLSGGERRRLFLCRVLMSAPNVLILDEPTNDLDIATLRILEDYLDTFSGIVIVVSHDRYFLDRVVRRIFAFKDDKTLMQSEGGYTDYEQRIKNVESKKDKPALSDASGKTTEKVKVKTQKLKMTYNEKREYETIEADIAKLEERISAIDDEVSQNVSDFVKLQSLSEEKQRLEEELQNKMDRWVYLEELSSKIENNL